MVLLLVWRGCPHPVPRAYSFFFLNQREGRRGMRTEHMGTCYLRVPITY